MCVIFIGLDQLLSDIASDWINSPINTLCLCSKDKTHFLSPKSALPLYDIDEKFEIMMSTHSILFHEIWEKHMENAAASVKQNDRAKLTIEDIKTVLWDGTFMECNNLLNSLQDRSIQLSLADLYFRPLQLDLRRQIEKLSTGVLECLGKPDNIQWIDSVVQHIQDYWSLSTVSEQAKDVITLKTKLSLSGVFKPIETLAKQVYK